MVKTAVTGIKPSGTPHIGNYFGVIRPALALARRYRAFYFIADYHALTTVLESALLRKWTYQIAAAWMALGLDPKRDVFYRQSDVPEIFELQWILSCVTSKGLLNRAHAYKAAVTANITDSRAPDRNINAGLFSYPVLMAADILLFGAEVVPVGEDQIQHIETARDIASKFNIVYGKVFTIPKALTPDAKTMVPGIDGRKMSKSNRNTIPLFADTSDIRQKVMRIVTDSKTAREPKNPDRCNVFAIYRHVAPPEAITVWRKRYTQGGAAYVDIKNELAELLERLFRKQRSTYSALLEEPESIDRVLEHGAATARAAARPMLESIRQRIGIGSGEKIRDWMAGSG